MQIVHHDQHHPLTTLRAIDRCEQVGPDRKRITVTLRQPVAQQLRGNAVRKQALALLPRRPQHPSAPGLATEPIQQAGLPKPRLALHEDHARPPIHRRRKRRPQGRKLGLARNERSHPRGLKPVHERQKR